MTPTQFLVMLENNLFALQIPEEYHTKIMDSLIDKYIEMRLICRDCLEEDSTGQCYKCRIKECGCNGDFRCCGYFPRDIYDN